jgi:hypothetical protein
VRLSTLMVFKLKNLLFNEYKLAFAIPRIHEDYESRSLYKAKISLIKENQYFMGLVHPRRYWPQRNELLVYFTDT